MSARGGRDSRPRIEWRDVDGILLLDKPVGSTSNQALQRARRLFRARKAGHTGSLDPLASGMLPLCFGEATKVSGFLLDSDKTYRARLALGARTATGDAEGEAVERAPVPVLDEARVRATLAGFVGPYRQVPPMYSALKRDGRPLYELARAGHEVAREARDLVLHRLDLLALAADALDFEVHCSKGTYVRTLGEDLARALGTVGHLAALRRLAVAPFGDAPLVTFETLEACADETVRDRLLLPADAALAGWPAVELDAQGAADVRHGRPADCAPASPGERVRLYAPGRVFIGIGSIDAHGTRVAPVRLLAAGGGLRGV
jgi:tRNA pseudouridine55 synthase